MTLASLRTSRRSSIAAFATLFVLASLLGGVANASTSPVRKYRPAITPTCVPKATNVRLTATLTNDASSNQPLGSLNFHSNTTNGFYNIFASSFTTPVASGGKTWKAVADTLDADGISLQATSSANALAPGQSVSVSFVAKSPSSTGNKTWNTTAWQATNFAGTTFSLASGATSPVINVATACGPATIQFTQAPPANVAAGGSIPSVKVQVLDAFNTPLNGQTVTLSSNDASVGTPSAVTSGTGATAGTATFTGLPVGTTPGNFTLTAKDGALTTSAPFAVVTGPATNVAFTQGPPASVAAGGDLGTVKVQVTDAFSNPLNGETVTLSSDDGAVGTPSALTSGTGTATFTGVPVGTSPAGFTLTAKDGAATTSAPFTVTPGAVASLEFVQQPTDTLAGDPITPAVTVRELDAFNNVVTTDNTSTISLAIGLNPGGSALSGGASQPVVNGIATFTNVSLDNSSSGYTLVATYDPNSGIQATSNPFDIESAQKTDCTNGCTATATNPDDPTSTVTVDAGGGGGGLSIVYESQPLDCGDANLDIGGTVTINPPSGAPLPVTVTFNDTISKPIHDSYPVCKTVEQGNVTTTELVPFCSDISNGLDRYGADHSNTAPCLDSQTVQFHGQQAPTLETVLLITSTDPVARH